LTLPFLSIVIPAFNEEHRLPSTLARIHDYLQAQAYSYEVLVVENGSLDRTYEIAEEISKNYAGFRVLKETARGKGLAIRRGMLAAQGEYCFMCDADLSMPIREIERFLPPILKDFDLAIASREAAGSIRYHEPAYRHLGGRFINLMIRALALPGLHDTQCGFKCFHSSVVEDLFHHQTLLGWSFDVELLYIARLRGYRIVEVPIPWYYYPESKVSPIKDAVRMGLDLLAIRRNAWRGRYGRKAGQGSTCKKQPLK
jgi:dolichyl-phosphate beta-glucosyltransferase